MSNRTEFRNVILKAINIREQALNPENQLFALSMSVTDEEVTRKEQTLLKCILGQFDKMFTED